jgi:CRP/FNR family transcriptional regulator
MPKTTISRLPALKRVPLFSALSERELQFLAERAVAHRYAAGELVFSESDPCEGLYVIESGTVKIFQNSADGREQILGIERAGSSLGEVPVFDGGPHPVSADASSEAVLLLIRKEDFRSLCLKHPDVPLKLLEVLGRRQRHLVNLVNELSFSTVRGRLAAYLLRRARLEGERTPGGVRFTLQANNREIAARIGTVRDLVSRNLGRLQAEGLIQLEGRSVTVPDLAALEAEILGTRTPGGRPGAKAL